MLTVLKDWFQRYFSDPQAGMLFFVLLIGLVILNTMSYILAPVLASIVIAYLLEWPTALLVRWKCPRLLAVIIVFILFLGLFIYALLGFMPLLWQQLSNFVNEIPVMASRAQALLLELPKRYPEFVSLSQLQHYLDLSRLQIGKLGKVLLSYSLAGIPGLVRLTVYLVLVPLLVYFMLMDRDELLTWFNQQLPRKRGVLTAIWRDVNVQIGNYVRGKAVEIIIVGIVSYITFILLGLPYAILLSVLVGLSVVIPFIGAIVVTFPVVIIAILTWGWSAHTMYLIVAYAIIITLDANVLVPVLFSEAVDLHPITIIVAILVFGAWWGFWGIFFAIPLAALVRTVIQHWPRN